jgi:hypothetical protein
VASNLPKTFVEVGGNVEVIVVANAAGTYRLDLADVPERARGTAVLLEVASNRVVPLTAAIRDGQRSFLLSMESKLPSVPNRADASPRAAAVLAALSQAVTTSERGAAQVQAAASVSESVSLTMDATFVSPSQSGSNVAPPAAAGGGAPQNQTEPKGIDNLLELLIESLEEFLRQVLGLFAFSRVGDDVPPPA